ncbi:hypothetical protein MVES1_002464 [Malassezia vespertilionis]|uniref:Beta-catenin-like protein 1 N-terminal domain-containing protein n=1 Tax=Malassezia vespertilionis TaxID=2020962 RepID=A0A2N1JAU9_9BASI|nr:uncharacterized protein MVES1_002464 [Malassezia vespertilionis]PKI83667.1 hypothetical protein MVES_002327 [Malassezia vespertilionis]WFD07107.1 hypothetical protein MVES1_002464 [Malassezia vespertilionis]
MDVGKLFNLPSVSSASVNKRKWNAPAGRPLDAIKEPPLADDNGSKRARVDDEDEEGPQFASDNADYFEDDDEEGRFFGGGLTDEQQQILEIMNRDGGQGAEAVQDNSTQLTELRKQLLQLEKTISKNQEMRLKYPDNPQRFIGSEADLDAELRALVVLTTDYARLYPEFVRLNGVGSVLELLSHENADIAGAAIHVLEELTDGDVLDEDLAGDAKLSGVDAMHLLVRTVRESQGLALLVSNLSRFHDRRPSADDVAALANYESDFQGVYYTLSLLENVVALQPDASEELVSTTSILPWLMERIQASHFDQNKAYAGELLAILLHDNTPNRAAFGEQGGVDALLRTIAPFRKRDPTDEEETEFMENCFDALCSALLYDANKKQFLDDEGIELMVLILRDKKQARLRAIKLLDHALGGAYGVASCERLVQALGLKYLFPIFMLPTEAAGKHKHHATSTQDMEHILGIFASLLHNLASDSLPRIRVLAKFVEQQFAKLDRLMELRDATLHRLAVLDRSAAQEKRIWAEQGLDATDQAELLYLRRMESGLYSLQLIDYILAWLAMEDDGAHSHIRMLLKRGNLTFSSILDVLQEYHDLTGQDAMVAVDAAHGGMRKKDIIHALLSYIREL